jgi:hypothetical protein
MTISMAKPAYAAQSGARAQRRAHAAERQGEGDGRQRHQAPKGEPMARANQPVVEALHGEQGGKGERVGDACRDRPRTSLRIARAPASLRKPADCRRSARRVACGEEA